MGGLPDIHPLAWVAWCNSLQFRAPSTAPKAIRYTTVIAMIRSTAQMADKRADVV